MVDIKEIIEFLNPWWKNGEVSKELAKEYRREIYKKVSSLKNYRQIVILSGLRRVGKTTLLYQLIEDLLREVDVKKVFYFNFDKEVKNLLELLNSYSEITSIDFRKEKIFVFLDELTKLNEWGKQIKIIYDSLPNIKFFVSSSSSINLEQEAIKELAGRYFLINVQPLYFKEFLELKKLDKYLKNINIYKKELNKEFELYLYRSFPETILWNDELLIKDYIKTTILDKIIQIDLVQKFRKINFELLKALIELFYSEPGFYLDYDKFSKDFRISKKTLYTHIFYLEFCYLIRIVKNFRPSTLSTKRKMQRVYPYWWNLAIPYCKSEDKLLENFVASIKNLNFYWRDLNKEIDFLEVKDKEIIAYEVKNKERIDERDLKSIIFFKMKYKPKEIFLISKNLNIKKEGINFISFLDFSLI